MDVLALGVVGKGMAFMTGVSVRDALLHRSRTWAHRVTHVISRGGRIISTCAVSYHCQVVALSSQRVAAPVRLSLSLSRARIFYSKNPKPHWEPPKRPNRDLPLIYDKQFPFWCV